MALLEVTSLRKAFGGVKAVAGVSFSLREQELVALIGPNGAGKSTCFHLLAGQLAADDGRVRFLELDILGLPPRKIWRLGVGRTFQIAATFSSLSALENVQVALLSHHRRLYALWPRAHGLYRDEAMDVLRRVGLPDGEARQPTQELSYGDLKRVELAVAMAHRPRLLLMDEPTAGMASRERFALMDLVADLVQKDKLSVLFTEHDMDLVFRWAERVLVMHRGRLIANGPPAEVRADPEVQSVYLSGFSEAGRR